MNALNPIAVRMMGASINRRTLENIHAAGLQIHRVEDLDKVGIFKRFEAGDHKDPFQLIGEILRAWAISGFVRMFLASRIRVPPLTRCSASHLIIDHRDDQTDSHCLSLSATNDEEAPELGSES